MVCRKTSVAWHHAEINRPWGVWLAAVAAKYTFVMVGIRHLERHICRHCIAVPMEQWTVSRCHGSQQRQNSLHLRSNNFFVEGALAFNIISSTSVEKPKFKSWSPQEPYPEFPYLRVGEENSTLHLRDAFLSDIKLPGVYLSRRENKNHWTKNQTWVGFNGATCKRQTQSRCTMQTEP